MTITVTDMPGISVYYTTDGSMPTHQSSLYGGPIFLHGASTLLARAYWPCVCADSAIARATFTASPADAGARDEFRSAPPP